MVCGFPRSDPTADESHGGHFRGRQNPQHPARSGSRSRSQPPARSRSRSQPRPRAPSPSPSPSQPRARSRSRGPLLPQNVQPHLPSQLPSQLQQNIVQKPKPSYVPGQWSHARPNTFSGTRQSSAGVPFPMRPAGQTQFDPSATQIERPPIPLDEELVFEGFLGTRGELRTKYGRDLATPHIAARQQQFLDSSLLFSADKSPPGSMERFMGKLDATGLAQCLSDHSPATLLIRPGSLADWKSYVSASGYADRRLVLYSFAYFRLSFSLFRSS